MKIIKVSVQEDFILRHDQLVFSLFVQTENAHEAEYMKLSAPFTVSDFTTALRALAEHLDKKYKNQ